MKRDEVIAKMCAIHGAVAHSHANAGQTDFYPADCFCHKALDPSNAHYQNTGKDVEYIRQAVMEKMMRDGITIHSKDFDENGKWVNPSDKE